MDENIYPKVFNEEETDKIISDKINNALNIARIGEMNLQKDILKKDLKRYNKMKSRWGKIDVGLKVSGAIFASTGAVVGVLVGTLTGPFIIPLLLPSMPIIVGVITASETLITSGLVIGVTSKKKSFYREKCKIIQSYLDKMYLYFERVREDNIITLEEINSFHKLLAEYRNELEGISKIEFDTKKIDKDLKKEIQIELLQERKRN